MIAPNLMKCCIFTKTSRIIGWVDSNLVRSVESGFFFNNVNIGLKGYLNFYGPPNGEEIKMTEFVSQGNSIFSKPVERVYSSYVISASQILFLFDLKPMTPSDNKPEKRQVEQRAVLAPVMVRFIDHGVAIKGKTYLHKAAYDERIIKLISKDKHWFVLQYPEFLPGYSDMFDQYWGCSKIAQDHGYKLDHLLVRIENVGISI
ncbi:MAG: hypothetical protein ACP5FK_05695 [bacterium]